MTDTYKPLGQAATSDTYSSEGLAYKVPTGTSAAISSVLITNTNDEDVTYSLAVVPQNETGAATQQVDFGHDFIVEYIPEAGFGNNTEADLKITRVSTGVVSLVTVPGVPTGWNRPRVQFVQTVGDRLIVVFRGYASYNISNRFNAQYYSGSNIIIASTTDAIEWTVSNLGESYAELFTNNVNSMVGAPTGTETRSISINASVSSASVFSSGVISLVAKLDLYDFATNASYNTGHTIITLDNYASASFVLRGAIPGLNDINTPWGLGAGAVQPGYYNEATDTLVLGYAAYGRKVIYSTGGLTYQVVDLVSTGSTGNLLGSLNVEAYTIAKIVKLKNGKLLFSLYSPWNYGEIYNRIYFADSLSIVESNIVFVNVDYYQAENASGITYKKTLLLENGTEAVIVGASGWLPNYTDPGLDKVVALLISTDTLAQLGSLSVPVELAPAGAAKVVYAFAQSNGKRILLSANYMDANNNYTTPTTVQTMSAIVTSTNIQNISQTLTVPSQEEYSVEINKGVTPEKVIDFHYYNVQPVYSSSVKNKIITKTISSSSTHTIDGGITLAAGDEVRLYSATNDVAINVYGAEITGSPMGYKVLGQLYYGPDITQEPEVPGSSSYYANQVITIVDKAFVFTVDSSGYLITNYSEDNGVTWQSKTHDFDGTFAIAFNETTHTFLVFDIWRKAFRVSNNGLDWTTVTVSLPTTQGTVKILSANGVFLAKKDNLSPWAAVSTDGISWETVSAPGILFSGYPVDISYSGGKLHVVFGDDYGDFRYLKSSTDGVTWTQYALPNGTYRVATNGSSYVAAVNTGTAFEIQATSDVANLTNWTPVVAALSNNQDIQSVNGKYVALSVDGNSSIGTVLLVSEDAFTTYQSINISNDLAPYATYSTWTALSVDLTVNKFILNTFGSVAGANVESYYSSTDGVTWTREEYPVSGAFGGWPIDNRFALQAGIQTITESFTVIGGQGTPGSYVEITEPKILYTVPASTETVVTSIFVTNNDTVDRTYDLAVVPADETLAVKHHIRWDMLVTANDIDLISSKLSLSAGDRLYVFPSTINKVGFTAFGVEKNVL